MNISDEFTLVKCNNCTRTGDCPVGCLEQQRDEIKKLRTNKLVVE